MALGVWHIDLKLALRITLLCKGLDFEQLLYVTQNGLLFKTQTSFSQSWRVRTVELVRKVIAINTVNFTLFGIVQRVLDGADGPLWLEAH